MADWELKTEGHFCLSQMIMYSDNGCDTQYVVMHGVCGVAVHEVYNWGSIQ